MPSNTRIFSVEEIQSAAALDKNVYDEDIEVAAKWIQDEYVERTLGTPLFDKIIEIVNAGTMDAPENVNYHYLAYNYILFIIAWGVRADIQPQLHNKVRNTGTVRSTDEHVDAVDQDDLYKNMRRYENRSKGYMTKTIQYLNCNADKFPEYNSTDCRCGETSRAQNTGYPNGIWLDPK